MLFEKVHLIIGDIAASESALVKMLYVDIPASELEIINKTMDLLKEAQIELAEWAIHELEK